MKYLVIPIVILFYCSLCFAVNRLYQKENDKVMKFLWCGRFGTFTIFVSSCMTAVQYLINFCSGNYYYFISVLLMLWFMSIFSVTDYHEKVIKNKVLLACLGCGVINIFVFFVIEQQYALIRLFDSLLGLILAAFIFGITYYVTKGKLGGGDVKLAVVMGLILGSGKVLAVLLYGVVICLIITCLLAFTKKISFKAAVPLCPFLLAGLWIVIYL